MNYILYAFVKVNPSTTDLEKRLRKAANKLGPERMKEVQREAQCPVCRDKAYASAVGRDQVVLHNTLIACDRIRTQRSIDEDRKLRDEYDKERCNVL